MERCFCRGDIDDIDAVFRLNQEVFEEAWPKDVLLQSLRWGYDLYVCMQGERLVGYVLSQDILDETQVMQLAVNQAFRRQGVAARLMDMLLQAKRDARQLMLEVRRSNAAARAFYRRLGFEESGIRPGYYRKTARLPREDAVLMTYVPGR